MPEYLHPGVYVEETSYRSPPFEGVSTSTAGLVGRTRKGREGHATLVTSFTEFVRTFGDPFPITSSAPSQLGDYLGHAVRAFFDNGGKRAYIVRALSATAQAAKTTIDVGEAYLLPPTTTVRGPTPTIPLTTTRGIEVGTSLKIFSRATNGTLTPRGSVLVTAIDVTRNQLTISPPLTAGVTLTPSSTVFEVGAGPGGAGPTFNAQSRGLDGNDIAVQIRPSDGPAVRLNAQRFIRAKLPVQVFSGIGTDIGPAAGNQLSLDANATALLLPTDILDLTTPDDLKHTISSITSTAKINVTGAAATVSGAIVLTKRNGQTAPGAITIDTLASTTLTGSAQDIAIPQAAAAILRPGDEITIGGSGAVTVNAPAVFTVAANNVTVTPNVVNHPATTVSVSGSTPLPGGLQRLVVADATVLVAPFDTPFQQIAVTDGTTTVTATVMLVDATENAVYVTGAAIPAGWTSFELLEVAGSSAGTVTVASTSSFYTGAIVELYDGLIGTKFVSKVTAIDPALRTVTLTPPPPLITVPADPTQRNAYIRVLEIDVLLYEAGVLAESFTGLSWNWDPASDSIQRYFVDRVNDPDNGSGLVSVTFASGGPADLTDMPMTVDGFPVNLGSGDNGGPLSDVDLIGHDNGPGQRTGIAALVERSDIALVAVPGVVDEEVQAALLTHCENLKYRFAILDGKPGVSDVTQIESHRNNYDSKYGGYYIPWLKTIDLNSGATMLAPPSGYVLGICARVDDERGVWKAPANEVVRNILDVELPFTDGEQDVLNPEGINLIRSFEGRGIRVWGARCTTSDQEWKYVNVRRLFIFLEHSIDNGTQWVVFEPNNEALWARVKESIESFLFGVWKSGALTGTKPEDAYFVRCDRTTMTQDDIDNGRLVCLIGVAPAYPAEFVIFRIGQFTASTNQA